MQFEQILRGGYFVAIGQKEDLLVQQRAEQLESLEPLRVRKGRDTMELCILLRWIFGLIEKSDL